MPNKSAGFKNNENLRETSIRIRIEILLVTPRRDNYLKDLSIRTRIKTP